MKEIKEWKLQYFRHSNKMKIYFKGESSLQTRTSNQNENDAALLQRCLII